MGVAHGETHAGCSCTADLAGDESTATIEKVSWGEVVKVKRSKEKVRVRFLKFMVFEFSLREVLTDSKLNNNVRNCVLPFF